MLLYHGTTQIIREIDLSIGRHRTDFGKGFYSGTNLEVAEKWAKSRAVFSGTPVVIRYVLDTAVFSDDAVSPLYFCEPSVEWLNFVKENRRKNLPNEVDILRHQHGIVYGPIANDKVNYVVEDYIKGKITVEIAIEKAKALPNAMQISLHNESVMKYLCVDKAEYKELLPNDIWSDWESVLLDFKI